VAGRTTDAVKNETTDHQYRVTGNAVAMGEAAGVTAALAVKNKTAPHDVPWGEVKSVIEKTRKPV